MNESIAKFYTDHFPEDTVIAGDAHQYLLDHYKEFDFIWSSAPCPSHSRARFWASKGGRYAPVFPDMKLYEEILFLKYYFEGKWVVENVNPFYDPLIKPTAKIGRHLFWSNFEIASIGFGDADIHSGKREDLQSAHGFDISGYQFTIRKDKILRNCVKPELGAHILRESKRVGMFTF